MTNLCAVSICGNPTHDAVVCTTCSRALFTDLVAVPWLLDQLAITLARLDRVAGQVGAAPAGTPLPLRWSASQAGVTLTLTLAPWAARVAVQRDVVFDVQPASLALSRWLAGHIVSVRQCQDAGELVDEVRYAIDQVRRAIDRPADLFYGGPCETCKHDLYCGADQHGRPAVSVIRCNDCGATYDTTERRAWLLKAAYDHIATATEIAQAVPSLYGQRIPVDTIRAWIGRGRLLPRAWLHRGLVYTHRQADHDRPLCRIGDVIDLASRRDQRTNAS